MNNTVLSNTIEQILGIGSTQKILIEQTLDRLYANLGPRRNLGASLECRVLRTTGQLMSPYLLTLLNSIPRSTIVEVGCGYGVSTNYIALLFPQTKIIGLDSDPKKISVAQQTIGTRRNIEFYCCDFEKMPKIETDLIILNLDSMSQISSLLKQAHEWLTPGGDLLIRTPHANTFWKTRFKSLLNPTVLKTCIKTWRTTGEWPGISVESMRTTLLEEHLSHAGYSLLGTAPVYSQSENRLSKALKRFVSFEYHHAEKPLYVAAKKNMPQPKTTASRPDIKKPNSNVQSGQSVVHSVSQQVQAGYGINFFEKDTSNVSVKNGTKTTRSKQKFNLELHMRRKQHDVIQRDLAALPSITPKLAERALPGYPQGRQAPTLNDASEEEDILGFIFSKKWDCLAHEL